MQDVGGAQRGDRGGHQIAPDRLQGGGEQDIAGVLALVDHPPVAGEAGAFDVGQQRVDQGRLALQGQSVWANRSHSAVIGPKSSTAVNLLSLRRYPMPAWSICRASHSRPLT